ncbi:hypothetical protein TSAR_014247 [Trichomalopsis sarcophagae]|uniref:Uncharacterized protein n=1 Tax=Trichomalopsis sarcophagae TaxID=543379 RepID=A0A232FKP7_9HYME|nr:hypothetical protein TSAR_014247 [Trichomalopsis sarcophagae]
MSCKRSSILSLAIFLIALSTGFCRSTANGFGSASDAFSSSQPRKTLDQEIGSPSELAWQAWLLVENKHGGQSPLDSSNILRRITPKSIFIAPELVACPSGYSSDGKGVCKPDPIKIDEDAQRQFFLKRLNALYGKFGNNRKKPEAQGPLQINIPISLPPKPEPQPQPPQQPEQKPPVVTENRLAIPVVISQQPPVRENQEAVAVVVYKVANDTKKPDEEKPSTTTFFLGYSNSSDPKKDPAQTGQVLQVAEIVDEMNETFSGVVDYKIPISLKPIFNRSDDEAKTTGDAGLDDRQTEKKVEGQDSSEDSSPTVVLLLSPTKLPGVRSTTEREMETEATDDDRESETAATVQTTEDDRRTDTTIQTVAPLDGSSTLRSTSTERSFTQDDETVYADEESQTQDSEDHEDHEDYDDTTAEDEFAEGEDELLKPGEAGMMIPSKNRELVRSKTQKHQPSTLTDEPASTTFVDATTITTFPTDSFESTFKTGATEELPSTHTTEIPTTIVTSTESSVRETTLYVTTPLRVKIPIKTTRPTPAPATTISDEIRLDETLETERDLVTEPEVIFSTQQNNYGRKRPMHPIRVAETPAYTSGLFEEPITRTEMPPVTVDFHRRQKPTMTVNNEPILFKNDGDIPSDFKDQMAESSKRVIPSFGSGNDEPSSSTYVRFPEQTPASRSQFSYVRFPSDDVNSIHSPEGYKDHLLSPYRSRDGDYSATSTKSSVPARQKSPSTNWRLPPPGVRMDRQQQQQQRQQKQKPMLLRFWARMPLVRDLSFYPTTSHGSHNEPIGGGEPETARLNSRFSTAQPRRVNYYKEMSSHDVNRLLAQQLGQPAIGG